MSATEPGLRERKRRATRIAIQQAALRIGNEHGVAAVTVDEISRQCDISPRTFFNYFASKDQALLGEDPVFPNDAIVEEFVAGGPSGDLLSDIGALLSDSVQEMLEGRELMAERQQLLKRNPELFIQRIASMKAFQAQLAAVVERRLLHDEPMEAPDDRATVERRARLAAQVIMAVVRHAWLEWSSTGEDGHLVDSLRTSFDELGALVRARPSDPLE